MTERPETTGSDRSRKAERPPELMRGKPSGADAPRPALEGETNPHPVPITLGEPALGRIMAGACAVLRRPPTPRWTAIRSGQLLWIREPFHLPAKFGGLSPTAAAGLGARPIFPIDHGRNRPGSELLGPQRISYTLLKAWHRQHLRVLEVRVERLQSITPAEVAAEGYVTRGGYAMAWDRALQVGGTSRGGPQTWEGNPEVVVFTFAHVATPIPVAPRPPPAGARKDVRPAPAREYA